MATGVRRDTSSSLFCLLSLHASSFSWEQRTAMRDALMSTMAARQQSVETLLGIAIQRKSLKQQLDSASINVEIGRTALADLPTVHIGCKRYIPEEYIANKNRKGRRSWIQAHGYFLTEVSSDLRTLQTYWVCAKCDERGKSSLFVKWCGKMSLVNSTSGCRARTGT